MRGFLVVIVKSWLKSLIGINQERGDDFLRDDKPEFNELISSELGNSMSNVDTIKKQSEDFPCCDVVVDPEGVLKSDANVALSDVVCAGSKNDVSDDDTSVDGDNEDDIDDAVTSNKQSGVEGGFDLEADDPLGEAFDLEAGESLAKAEVPAALPWKARIASAKEFFATEILYRYDILLKEERERILGQYRIELKGYQGGVWSIDIGDDISVVNRREDAPVVLTMQQIDFMRIVNGELNPQMAILARKVKITGDIRKAVALQLLLAPSSE